jgi:hypothetical protein
MPSKYIVLTEEMSSRIIYPRPLCLVRVLSGRERGNQGPSWLLWPFRGQSPGSWRLANEAIRKRLC